MHKNWVIKGYDQSVTCLADDLPNLGTPNKLKRKSDQKSRSEIIAENLRKRKMTNRLMNERSLSTAKRRIPFVKTNQKAVVR